ncbi:hypothetical protein [Parvularcula marina]|uniref:Flagellar biosynthesis protein FlgB n=1 Tax=Parvularcula marina TaxID=2292771 RepID=A0A371RGZ4_9PROT|nr:hypothetical protein [Parvularcula marina]RFB04723.1 hypothetical protein DX908_05180 [Parvularcula marina]
MIGSNNGILDLAKAMAEHAAFRQATVTENLAQANTPGYRAKEVAEFSEIFDGGDVLTTRVDQDAAIKPNGNSVSLEAQIVELAEARGQHDMALGLWERVLSMYTEALGRR